MRIILKSSCIVWLLFLLPCWSGMGVVSAQEITATLTLADNISATSTATVLPTLLPTSVDLPMTPFVTHTATETLSATPTPVPTTLPATQTPHIIHQIITQPPIIVTAPPLIVVQQQSVESQLPITVESATIYPSDIFGWSRFESVGLVQVMGTWQLTQSQQASSGAYHRTRSSGALLRLPFEGEGIRVGFLKQNTGGSFLLKIDGEVLGVFETNATDEIRYQTKEHFFSTGYHVLDIVSLVPTDLSQSLAIDYVDIFNGPTIPVVPTVDIPPTIDRIVLTDIKLVAVPPSPISTVTPLPASDMTLDVLIGYDLNTNGEIEPTEGVRGLSVRLVNATDNRLLASGFTDTFGFVQIRVQTSNDAIAFVPLLGESRMIRQGTTQTAWSIQLEPANVPGLIP